MSSIWRIIDSGSQDGPTNMAVDEAILSAVSTGQSPSTLRFYSWNPICLSIGRSQQVSDVDLERLGERGFDIVRRPTGGRSILHCEEFTYSICMSKQDPIAIGGVLSTYRRISNGILASLKSLGVVVDNQIESSSNELSGPVCFEYRSHYEISVNGRKLLGSAQMRNDGGVRQHGSLPLDGDIANICDVLNFSSENDRQDASMRVRNQATTLTDVLDHEVSWKQITNAFMYGFSDALDLQFSFDSLTQSELQHAEFLQSNKYANLAWTHRHNFQSAV